jgi:hypothetical protein
LKEPVKLTVEAGTAENVSWEASIAEDPGSPKLPNLDRRNLQTFIT